MNNHPKMMLERSGGVLVVPFQVSEVLQLVPGWNPRESGGIQGVWGGRGRILGPEGMERLPGDAVAAQNLP